MEGEGGGVKKVTNLTLARLLVATCQKHIMKRALRRLTCYYGIAQSLSKFHLVTAPSIAFWSQKEQFYSRKVRGESKAKTWEDHNPHRPKDRGTKRHQSWYVLMCDNQGKGCDSSQ